MPFKRFWGLLLCFDAPRSQKKGLFVQPGGNGVTRPKNRPGSVYPSSGYPDRFYLCVKEDFHA